MTTTMISGHCQAAHQCQQTPCFQARLEARGGLQPIRRTAEFCAEHLGDAVHDLTNWAHGCGLTDGQVTVLIIDPVPGELVSLAAGYDPQAGGLPFGTIPLSR